MDLLDASPPVLSSPEGQDESQSLAVDLYCQGRERDPELPVAVVACRALTDFLEASEFTSFQAIYEELKKAREAIRSTDPNSIPLRSACDIYYYFITRSNEVTTHELKRSAVEKGEKVARQFEIAPERVAAQLAPWLRNNTTVLVHGFSPVVVSCLKAAAKPRRFRVIVTEGRSAPPPSQADLKAAFGDADGQGQQKWSDVASSSGALTAAALAPHVASVEVVPDVAVGVVVESVDFVLMGAEGVVENGGVIGTIGTYQAATLAHAVRTPVYIAAESYRFTRRHPLRHSDIPQVRSEYTFSEGSEGVDRTVLVCRGLDYTPPALVTLLFTDLGTLTPAAVSDELIKLYQ